MTSCSTGEATPFANIQLDFGFFLGAIVVQIQKNNENKRGFMSNSKILEQIDSKKQIAP